jgi:hypothetical protein
MILDNDGSGPMIQRKEFIFVVTVIFATAAALIYDKWIAPKLGA